MYNAQTNDLYYKDNKDVNYTLIFPESLIQIWKIKNENPITSCFEDFWTNSLVLIESSKEHAQLIWGLIPDFNATSYKIYRAIGNSAGLSMVNYSLIAQTSVGVFEYVDEEIDLSDNQYVFYYVAAYNSSTNQNSQLTNLVYTKEIANKWKASLLLETSTGINPHLYWSKYPSFEATNYKIYRAVSSVPNPRNLSYSLIHTTSSANVFEYIDEELSLGNFDYVYYYVVAYNSATNTNSEPSNVITTRAGMYKQAIENNENPELLTDFVLKENYPNPFNPTTTIHFVIPNEVRNLKDFSSQAPRNDNVFVTLRIYDVLGREVATLVNEQKPAGNYEVTFDASDLTSGIYFYRLETGSFAQTRKMILLR